MEIKLTGNFKGFDYEVTQEFVCGSRITGEKSEFVNRLTLKEGEQIILKTHWKGKESEAYLKMKALDEISWFLENREIFEVQWNDTEIGFKGEIDDIIIICNIEQNRAIIHRNDDPIEQIEITFEYPMPIYDENVLSGLFEGEEVFNINLTGDNEKDIEQLKNAIEAYVKSLPDDF
jgi:hypothetical protein